jgi:hypothetical protein
MQALPCRAPTGLVALLLSLACGASGGGAGSFGGGVSSLPSAAPPPRCTPGASRECNCSARAAGTQQCQPDHRFSPCICHECQPGAFVSCRCGDRPGVALCLEDGVPEEACNCRDPAVSPPPITIPDAALPYRRRVLPIAARHLVHDPLRNAIYATVATDAPTLPGTIAIIDTVSFAMRGTVTVGREPNHLALSDDGSTLWVGVDGDHAIQRLDLRASSLAPGPPVSLPRAPNGGATMAGTMVVLPGTTASVAIALVQPYDPPQVRVAILDDGVARRTTPAFPAPSRITSGPPGWLFGYDDRTNGEWFFTIRIATTALMQTERRGLLSGSYADLVYADDRVYAGYGQVLDVRDPERPTPVGTLPTAGLRSAIVLRRGGFRRAVLVTPIDFRARPAYDVHVVETDQLTEIAAFTVDAMIGRAIDAISIDDTLVFLSETLVRQIEVVTSGLLTR